MQQMTKKIKRKAKTRTLSTKMKGRVVSLATRRLSHSVSTIGYSTTGIQPAVKLLQSESYSKLKEILGGKGAGLTSMVKLGLPVPPAISLSTPLCGVYLQKRTLPESILKDIRQALFGMQKFLKREFGSRTHPLLLSVRSGARVSMPGMMDTILNLGLNHEITTALADAHPEKERFWWDCYRRFIQMYSEVVMGVEYSVFDHILESWKSRDGVKVDSELSVSTLKKVCSDFEASLQARQKQFPQDPWEQLIAAIEAVFRSWNTDRAITYRKLNSIPDEWGTAVTIQAMVFGNLNEKSATGVVFTRDPSHGANRIYGEYLLNAQGEDVVAGIRTPQEIQNLKSDLPKAYAELTRVLKKLEHHFRDVQDVEFTIENERLFVLQTRSAKRTAAAQIEHIAQFVNEKRISKAEGLSRISYDQVKQLLHPTLKATSQRSFAKGLPASPGAVSGKAAFDPETAVDFARGGQRAILVRRDTSPEDIMGMAASEGILTSTGGMTSHAAVVGRGMGKACVVGCSDLEVDEHRREASAAGVSFSEGDWITINGATGDVYMGDLPTEPVTWGQTAQKVFSWADESARIPVLANADTPEQASLALGLGAKGIGLCRTEHMFFEKERIHKFRAMILSESEKQRTEAAKELQSFQEDDFYSILKVMKGFSVCVRLLDPPLHEFLPKVENEVEINALIEDLNISSSKLFSRIQQLAEVNPMLGHRGCRLGVTFPEIYEMQVRALAGSLIRNLSEKVNVTLKIMIPLVMTSSELDFLLSRLKKVYVEELDRLCHDQVALKQRALKATLWGTMIELPRACLVAADIAHRVDFFSFGTNDLTQTTMGLSRDDASKFIPAYLEKSLLPRDPFETLDQQGVGRLIRMAVTEGRKVNKNLEIGICGEHGGDPQSVEFFEREKFDSVSCSPFRVPLARLAASRARQLKKER